MKWNLPALCSFFAIVVPGAAFGQLPQGNPDWAGFGWLKDPERKEKAFTFSRPFTNGSSPAFVVRNSDVEIHYFIPRPLTEPERFAELNPDLFSALPGLESAIENAEVSALFEEFYEEKVDIFGGGGSLDHYNFFDCASILEGTLPESGEEFILLQTDMDVDTDGTDPERFPNVEDYEHALVSRTYQPQLSYSWYGGTSLPKNPMIDYYSKANGYLQEKEEEFRAAGEKTTALHEKRAWSAIAEETGDLADLYANLVKSYEEVDKGKRRSLVGGKDPFIVIPGNWDKYKTSDPTGRIERGSLAAVIVGGTVYPAIVGDSGVSYKMGEASLLIAKTVNEKASGRYRAVTGPKATYIIFPKTGNLDKIRSMPDFEKVQAEVKKRLDEMVSEGKSANYFDWKTVRPADE